MEVLQQRPGRQNIKRSLLIKENQTSQIKEFNAFLGMERRKSLGALKSLLWYVPQLSGASIHSVLTLSPQMHPWRGQVAAVADVPCGHPLSILSSLGVHRRGDCNVKAWWAATSLVYWYDRWHFSSTVFHFINQKTEKINTFIFWPQTVSLSAPLLLGVTWCFCNGAAGFRPRPGIKASVLTCLPGLSSMSLSEHSPWEQIRASCKAGGMSDIWK